jgi:hypothetical protein
LYGSDRGFILKDKDSDFEESTEELEQPLLVKRFSVSKDEMVKTGILFLMREVSDQVIKSLWYFLAFKYVLHFEIEFWPFVLVVFLGGWLCDAVRTAIDNAVRRDVRKVVMTVGKDRIMYEDKSDPRDDGSE